SVTRRLAALRLRPALVCRRRYHTRLASANVAAARRARPRRPVRCAAPALALVSLGWILVVPAYLLGTFPTAILVGRRRGRDVTTEGSGNPGASNTLRTMGRRAAAAVLLGDLGKGAVAAGVGLLAGRGIGVACGLAAVLGHV